MGLIRWRHPVYGLLTPDVFLPVVEKCGLSDDPTRYVLRAALRHRASWHQRSGVDVPVAVNLFTRNLLDPSFPSKVNELIVAAGTPPERVILEIPESIVSTELDVVIEVLAGLKALGAQLSLDGFEAAAPHSRCSPRSPSPS